MTTRDIQSHLAEVYGAAVSPALISKVTDVVAEEITAWQTGRWTASTRSCTSTPWWSRSATAARVDHRLEPGNPENCLRHASRLLGRAHCRMAFVYVGLLLQGFVNVMSSAYSLRDTTTAEGVDQPTTSLRSGGPGSLIPWDTLSYQGRNFVGKGPTVSDIEKFTGHPAMEPIRAYAGLASAPDAESRAPWRSGNLSAKVASSARTCSW